MRPRNSLSISTNLALLGTVLVFGSCSSAPPPGKNLGAEYYNLGNSYFDLKNYKDASRAYQNALAWDPDLKIANLNLARCKAELGDAPGALALLGPLAATDPDNLIVAQYRAWLTAKQSGPAAAADLYLALSDLIPGDSATQLNAGLCLRAAGRNDEALASLNTWKAMDGKLYPGMAAIAEILAATDDPGTADAWMNAALALPDNDSKRFDPLFSRAKVLEKDKIYGDGVKAIDSALALPVVADQPRGEALFHKGSMELLGIEDYPAGQKALLESWKAGYKDAGAWKNLLENPDLKTATQLRADLKLAGIEP